MIHQIICKAWGNTPFLARLKCKLFHRSIVGESTPGCLLSSCPKCGIVYNNGGYVLNSEDYHLFKVYEAIYNWYGDVCWDLDLWQALSRFFFLAGDNSNCR